MDSGRGDWRRRTAVPIARGKKEGLWSVDEAAQSPSKMQPPRLSSSSPTIVTVVGDPRCHSIGIYRLSALSCVNTRGYRWNFSTQSFGHEEGGLLSRLRSLLSPCCHFPLPSGGALPDPPRRPHHSGIHVGPWVWSAQRLSLAQPAIPLLLTSRPCSASGHPPP